MVSPIRLMIADDEEIARKALRLLLQKEMPEIELLPDASNGIEFAAMAQELKPDIAIVDVNMPGMTGIEAVEFLLARNCKTRFIIHTAYDEFDYVQKALSLKVDGYLLKPAKRGTTVETIRKVCRQIRAAKADRISQSKVDDLFTRIVPIMEREILYSLFIGEPAQSTFESYCEVYGIRFHAGVVVSLLPRKNGVLLRNAAQQDIRNKLDEALRGSCNFLAAVTESNICLLILIPPSIDGEQIRAWLTDVLRVMTDRLEKLCHMAMRVGVGGIYGDFGKMDQSYLESHMALLDTSGEEICFSASKLKPDSTRLDEKQLLSMVLQGNLQQLESLLCEAYCGAEEALRVWDSVCTQTAKRNDLSGQIRDLNVRLGKEIASGDENAAANLKKGLYQLVYLLSENAESGETGKNYVRQALEFIQTHYREDVSLEDAAEVCGVSSYYLSRQFRVELGQTFVECLTQIRINAAMELAAQTRLSVREIAERTGYNNPTYFCRVFKKYTGKTISEYRENQKLQ